MPLRRDQETGEGLPMNRRQEKKLYKQKYGNRPPNKYEKALHDLLDWMLVYYYTYGNIPEIEFLTRLQKCNLSGQIIALQKWDEIKKYSQYVTNPPA